MTKIREHLDFLVAYAGIELNKIGKILVPNIAESRLRYGKWEHHSAYGGGFEEVWLGLGSERLPVFAVRRDAGPRDCERLGGRREPGCYFCRFGWP